MREQYIKNSMVTMMSEQIMKLEGGEDVFDIMMTTEQQIGALYPTDIQGGDKDCLLDSLLIHIFKRVQRTEQILKAL